MSAKSRKPPVAERANVSQRGKRRQRRFDARSRGTLVAFGQYALRERVGAQRTLVLPTSQLALQRGRFHSLELVLLGFHLGSESKGCHQSEFGILWPDAVKPALSGAIGSKDANSLMVAFFDILISGLAVLCGRSH
jgi:hypothetical protein